MVHRAEADQEIARFGEGLDALHRAVRHVRGALAFPVEKCDVCAFRDEVQDHLDVSSCGGVVQRRPPLVVPSIDVGATLLHQILNRRQESRGMVPVVVCGESLTVSCARGRVQRRDGRAPDGNGRQPGDVLDLATLLVADTWSTPGACGSVC